MKGRPMSDFSRLANHRKEYQNNKVDGKKKVDCGDQVAAVLRGLSLEEVYRLVLDLTGKVKDYRHLNPGQQRMNLGNVLRVASQKDSNVRNAIALRFEMLEDRT